MEIVSLVLNLFTYTILFTTQVTYVATGLYPREQLGILQEATGSPESAGFMDVLVSLSS